MYGKIDSTNAAAKDLAERGAPGGTIVLCREQTQGKGQKGRAWLSPPRIGVYLSMVFRPSRLSNPALLPILAGLGIVGKLDRCFPTLEPAIKWPNDIIVRDRKCAGVLAEATWSDRSLRHLVVGVGVNVKPLPGKVPATIRKGAISIEEALGREVRLAAVAEAVVQGLEAELASPAERLSPALLETLDRYDWLRDRRARVFTPGDEVGVSGICVGIAPDGALLFRPDRGALRRVKSAHVEAER